MFSANTILIAGIFILGTYIVATLDDLIRMKASRSFIYIWAFLAIVFAGYRYLKDDPTLYIRLIIAVCIYVFLHFNIFRFKIATGDVIAMLPFVFLLNSYLNIAYFIIAVLIFDRIILRLFYVKLLRRKQYPFMPAILGGAIIILLLVYGFQPMQEFDKYVTGVKDKYNEFLGEEEIEEEKPPLEVQPENKTEEEIEDNKTEETPPEQTPESEETTENKTEEGQEEEEEEDPKSHIVGNPFG